jgi:hypothetical protein
MIRLRQSVGWVALALALLTPDQLLAEREPYLAVRTGQKCSACHVNRTGGGMRNDFGVVYAGASLPMTTEGFQFQNRALNDFIRMGADFRLTASALLSDATARDDAPRTALNINRANLYIEAKLLSDKLTLYLDETLAPGGATSREFFALVDIPEIQGYAKVGTFFLPSGLRILDDQEFIRELTGFTMLAADQGVEVGIEPGRWSIQASVTNGSRGATESNDGKQVTGTAAWVGRRFRLGASASRNTQEGLHTDVLGGFGGVTVGNLSLLGEVDYVQGASGEGPDVEELVAYGEGNLLIRQGVNAKVTYGFHDRDVDRPEDERVRARFGLELFPFPYFQVSGFYVLRDDIPENLALALPQRDELLLELHLLF